MKSIILWIKDIFGFESSMKKSFFRTKVIGTSPRGQFIAFEEFGYINGREKAFSKIRIFNTKNKMYILETAKIITSTSQNSVRLSDVREKAKKLSLNQFKQFNILL